MTRHPAIVRKRYFFQVYGFDPDDVGIHYRRFVRKLARFAATWNVTAAVSPLRETAGECGNWTVAAQGPDWRVEACYVQLDWSDIVRADLARSSFRRLWHGIAAFADLVVTGTAVRYFFANWRYGLFFLVPFLTIILFAAIAVSIGCLVAASMPSAFWHAVAWAAVAALVFGLLMRWPGKRWRIKQAVADWIFAREYNRGKRPDVSGATRIIRRPGDRLRPARRYR